MKAKIFMAVITLLLTANTNFAETLPKPSCTAVDYLPFYYTLEDNLFFEFVYSCYVAPKDGAVAYIYHHDEILATCKLRAEETWSKSITIIEIEPDVSALPKGRMYTVQIPAGMIYSKDDPTICNELLSYDFCVPSYIACIYLHKEVGESIANGMMFYYDLNLSAPNSPLMEVYRDGVLVGTAPVSESGGSDSFVSASPFNVAFEDGVPYTLVLPEGSLWVSYGADMPNPEISVNLIGSVIESYPTANYVDMEKIFDPETNVLSKVIFYYDQPIMLVGGGGVQLFDGDNLVIKTIHGNYGKDAYSYYGEDDGTWMLVADFHNVADKLEPGKDYTAVPAGGSVYAVTDIHGSSSAQLVESGKEVLLGCTDGTLTVKNAAVGSRISAYTVDGRIIGSTVADGTAPATMPLPVKGLYIVTVGQRSYKVMNR